MLYYRGENKSGGWIFKPVPDNPNRSLFCWIFNSDLKVQTDSLIFVKQCVSNLLGIQTELYTVV